MEGSGILTWKEGHFWDGGMKTANPHGKGTFYFENGDYNQVLIKPLCGCQLVHHDVVLNIHF